MFIKSRDIVQQKNILSITKLISTKCSIICILVNLNIIIFMNYTYLYYLKVKRILIRINLLQSKLTAFGIILQV